MDKTRLAIKHTKLEDGVYWTLFSPQGKPYKEFSFYLIDCLSSGLLDYKTIRSRAYTLKSWYEYLANHNLKLLNANDHSIKTFRDEMSENSNSNRSDDSLSRKRSINQYLRIIYRYYHWLQQADYSSTLCGSSIEFNIQSTLHLEKNLRSGHTDYPLLYRNTLSRSKHQVRFTPNYEDFLTLYDYFLNTQPEPLALRNCLILKIAYHQGFRVEAISSLKTGQFDLKNFKGVNDRFPVRPEKQKFGTLYTFDIPAVLATDIREYILTSRNHLLSDKSPKTDYIFLSSTDGTPLRSETISQIFSNASSKLDWPRGSGIHSWRGSFTENLIETQLDINTELGHDTSSDTIGLSIARELGHSNIQSQEAYVRKSKITHRATQTFRFKNEIEKERTRNLKLLEQNAKLRSELLSS